MRGGFWHAGNENKTKFDLYRFFIFLDKNDTFRNAEIQDRVYLNKEINIRKN